MSIVAPLTVWVGWVAPPAPGVGMLPPWLRREIVISFGLKSKYTNPMFGSVMHRSDAGTRAPASAAAPIAAPARTFAPAATMPIVIIPSQKAFVGKHKRF